MSYFNMSKSAYGAYVKEMSPSSTLAGDLLQRRLREDDVRSERNKARERRRIRGQVGVENGRLAQSIGTFDDGA